MVLIWPSRWQPWREPARDQEFTKNAKPDAREGPQRRMVRYAVPNSSRPSSAAGRLLLGGRRCRRCSIGNVAVPRKLRRVAAGRARNHLVAQCNRATDHASAASLRKWGCRTQGQAPAPELLGSGKHELSAPSGAEEKGAGLWVLRQSIRGLIISRAGVFLNHAKRRC